MSWVRDRDGEVKLAEVPRGVPFRARLAQLEGLLARRRGRRAWGALRHAWRRSAELFGDFRWTVGPRAVERWTRYAVAGILDRAQVETTLIASVQPSNDGVAVLAMAQGTDYHRTFKVLERERPDLVYHRYATSLDAFDVVQLLRNQGQPAAHLVAPLALRVFYDVPAVLFARDLDQPFYRRRYRPVYWDGATLHDPAARRASATPWYAEQLVLEPTALASAVVLDEARWAERVEGWRRFEAQTDVPYVPWPPDEPG